MLIFGIRLGSVSGLDRTLIVSGAIVTPVLENRKISFIAPYELLP